MVGIRKIMYDHYVDVEKDSETELLFKLIDKVSETSLIAFALVVVVSFIVCLIIRNRQENTEDDYELWIC